MLTQTLRYPKSLWSYNPIPEGCKLYLPLWSPDLNGSVFKSADPFRHTCTVIGAVHGNDGRLFDGLDDKITVPDVASITDIFDGGGTAVAWCNLASDGELSLGYLMTKGVWVLNVEAQAAGKVKVNFDIVTDDVAGEWITTATEVTLNVWTQIIVTYNSTNLTTDPIIYVNGSAVSVTESQTPTGTRISDAGTDVTVGNDPTQVVTTDGTIGEALLYNRALSAGEVAHIYRLTKGRYQ